MDENGTLIVKAWFKKADNDLLNIANNLAAAMLPVDTVYFHAQQAIEKYMKGVLVLYGERISKTHDLVFLLNSVKKYLPELQSFAAELESISRYGVEARYPDILFEPALAEARKAYTVALEVKRIVVDKLHVE
jgi:HEPN domain-containing protein